MIYKAININYDTDDSSDLPEEIQVDIPAEITDDIEILDYIGDMISELTGFCHMGFSTDPEI